MSYVRSIVVLVAAAALALPAVASADTNPTRVSLSSTATWISPQQINLEVVVTCEEGSFYSLFGRVMQQQGPFMQIFGSGSTNGTCTGRHQKVALPIFQFSFPGWQLGAALADVSVCAFTCDSAARSIRIVL
jgi:hypothetical protein